jgi:hypothetical protein
MHVGARRSGADWRSALALIARMGEGAWSVRTACLPRLYAAVRGGATVSCEPGESRQPRGRGLRMPGCDFGIDASSTQPETAMHAMMSG